MQKVAGIFSFKMSNWVSCQKIVLNLPGMYQQNRDLDLLNFNYSGNVAQAQTLHTAEPIVAAKLGYFSDPRPQAASGNSTLVCPSAV